MNTLDAILSRSSCRSYTDEQITEEELEKLLVAANAAPVGMATYQCISLTVIQDKALMDRIEGAVADAMPQMPNKHPLYNAPTCILVSVKRGDEGMRDAMYTLSASCIMENILVEAADLGLGSTYLMGAANAMAGSADICKAAKVPDGFAPVAMAAVGHPAQAADKKEPTTDKIACERA